MDTTPVPFGTRVRHADGRCCKSDQHGRFVVTAVGVDDPDDGFGVWGRVCDRPIEEHLLIVPTQEAGDDGPTPANLLAEIEKGQQLGGHQPSPEALDVARQILDGTLDPEQARSDLVAKHTLVPADELSDRERWALRAASRPLVPAERRELLDFLQYPNLHDTTYADRVEAVVRRILQARARGEHIS